MFGKKRRSGAAIDEERLSRYELDWPSAQRWNPHYAVPRNSLEQGHADPSGSFNSGVTKDFEDRDHANLRRATRSMSYGRNKRDMDTRVIGIHAAGIPEEIEEEEFSNLKLWIETISELYMNELDNRARWDPRWLNITRRERFEGLESAAVSIVDYMADDSVERSKSFATVKDLAGALDVRPADSQVRVIMVTDLSRFIMGALGQLYSIDPEFWYEHLVASGYSASDSGLKLKNAAWMNWPERELRFRHRALPGIGQRTEWNLPRRTKSRKWVHLRWGRLGLLHYLGRKGFHEDEIQQRVSDGRWTIERDIVLNKYGLPLVGKRKELAEKKMKERKKKKKNTGKEWAPQPPNEPEIEGTSTRSKTTNVYRPYSTFHPVLPRNPTYWNNRDLRVMAPEGMGYWSSVDAEGRKTIILLFDPQRQMKHNKTKEITPSLTFMPRAMEFESYTDEELWRTADPGETYLDPPPPPLSKEGLKAEKKAARKQRLRDKKSKLQVKLNPGVDGPNGRDEQGYETTSSYSSDTEYDEEYEQTLRDDYKSPQPYVRDRDFARKYSLSTVNLVYRYISTIPTSDLCQDDSLIPSVLTRLTFDDTWQLLSELRMMLDQIDADLGADIHTHLLESVGLMTRQNVGWVRSTLQELNEWTGHMNKAVNAIPTPAELMEELAELTDDLKSLQSRSDQTLNLLVASTGLAQSTLVIDQTSGINKLTELAFFFIPLSFVTSIFSMQVAELTETPPKIWTWGLSLGLVFIVTYIIRSIVRSPSVRIVAMGARVTMLNRFTSSHSASRRLNSVGNGAIIKFFTAFSIIMIIGISLTVMFLLFHFLLHFGIWLAAAGTAMYFIITRWPEPAVLAPCFVAMAVAAGGASTAWYWREEILEQSSNVYLRLFDWIRELFPDKWFLDTVDDEDLDNEGVKTFNRQAFILATA
ncbi:hypothetical protein FZEAL_8199 [Fusarium zealandicum]|uniref:Mg2+ transporter protein, CorA-like/Zinc transport protein ZntB n=1 Tax=Fusarium zealandicum TaxID=1053134 RepID=A0A8H4UEU1_9HYPO|nr:hypothetical protein FZEAL_8199 [Fusarium zealandicum]